MIRLEAGFDAIVGIALQAARRPGQPLSRLMVETAAGIQVFDGVVVAFEEQREKKHMFHSYQYRYVRAVAVRDGFVVAAARRSQAYEVKGTRPKAGPTIEFENQVWTVEDLPASPSAFPRLNLRRETEEMALSTVAEALELLEERGIDGDVMLCSALGCGAFELAAVVGASALRAFSVQVGLAWAHRVARRRVCVRQTLWNGRGRHLAERLADMVCGELGDDRLPRIPRHPLCSGFSPEFNNPRFFGQKSFTDVVPPWAVFLAEVEWTWPRNGFRRDRLYLTVDEADKASLWLGYWKGGSDGYQYGCFARAAGASGETTHIAYHLAAFAYKNDRESWWRWPGMPDPPTYRQEGLLNVHDLDLLVETANPRLDADAALNGWCVWTGRSALPLEAMETVEPARRPWRMR